MADGIATAVIMLLELDVLLTFIGFEKTFCNWLFDLLGI